MPLFGGPNLDDVMFQLRFSAKQLERESKKAEKEEKVLRAKVKTAIKGKNIEFAQIHAGKNFNQRIIA
jgi:charged multivesicular body protein 1